MVGVRLRMKSLRLCISGLLGLFLFAAYFLRNPTSMTLSKIKLTRACLLSDKLSDGLAKFLQLKLSAFQPRQECQIVYPLIEQIFEFEIASRNLVVEGPFKKKVHDWFQARQSLMQNFQLQTVTTVYNKWTRVTTVRNPLRADRPKRPSGSDIMDMISSSQQECDFCAKNFASDPIGNLSNERIFVAANAFKMQDYHALFVPDKHNPLSLEESDYADLFEISTKWAKAAIKDSNYGLTHPVLIWDSLPHAGASQMHTHMHGFVGRGHSLGHFRAYQEARAQYALTYAGSDLTQDYINVHMALGLGLRVGHNVILMPLDAVKDHEFLLLGPSIDEDFAKLLSLVIDTYRDELGVLCWSSAMAWPNDGDLAMLRIGSRGDCASYVSDVSSLELYMFNSIDTDPYGTLAAFRRRFDFAKANN